MRQRILGLVLVVAIAGCGGGSSSKPSAGTPTSPSPPPGSGGSTWSIGGVVIDAVTGGGVSGATLAFSGLSSVTTGAGGAWQLQGTGSSPSTVLSATISASGFHTRDTRIEWRSGRSDVELSLFPDRAPFSLAFFRQLARNGHEEPNALEPIRRWSSNPNFYLNAHNPRTNAKLTDAEVEMIETTVRRVIPQISGGSLVAGFFDVGVTDRSRRVGYINIEIVYEPDEDYCARAFVGANPGLITINYDACRVSWCREGISPNVVAHELGHAMGLWHTPSGVMIAELDDCYGTTFTTDEQLHARMAYLRANGNRDVDRDPTSFQAMTAEGGRRISCGGRRR